MDMSQKTIKAIIVGCLIFAVTGVYILMLKNPENNVLTIPVLILIVIALAFSAVRPQK